MEKEYLQLTCMTERAKELIRDANNKLQKLPGRMFNVSRELFGNADCFSTVEDKYINLGKKVKSAKRQLKEFSKEWHATREILDQLDRELFFAEAHVLVNSERCEKGGHRNRQWKKRYMNY